jgi:FlaA1/EpsC-like NDP-sugar epimerase
MGDPLSIKELAEQMIRFYGYEPEKEIDIHYIGLRPGEKLIERLWAQGDTPCSTQYSKIMKLNRASAINGHLKGIIKGLKPICFFDPGCKKEYRNRQCLREVLNPDIPSLRIPDDEPQY